MRQRRRWRPAAAPRRWPARVEPAIGPLRGGAGGPRRRRVPRVGGFQMGAEFSVWGLIRVEWRQGLPGLARTQSREVLWFEAGLWGPGEGPWLLPLQGNYPCVSGMQLPLFDKLNNFKFD